MNTDRTGQTKSHARDPFDELAAMFLTAPSPVPPVGAPAVVMQSLAKPTSASAANPLRVTATIELLVIGHLPVRAGLWLTPYADAMARKVGSTALVRLDGEQPSVQILRGPQELASAPIPDALQPALAQVGANVDLWIVRVAEGTPAGDLAGIGSDRITILTSADEAAVVAAYQLIKDLAQAAEAMGKPLQSIGLAVVGADQSAAAGVIDRLNRTTISFLGVEVRLMIAIPRMDAGVVSTRYAAFHNQVNPAIADVMMWIDEARREAASGGCVQRDVAGQLFVERGVEAAVIEAARVPGPSPAQRHSREFADFSEQRSAPPVEASPTHGTRESHAQVHKTSVSAARSVESTIEQVIAGEGASGAKPIKLAPKRLVEVEAKQPATAREPDVQGRPAPLSTYVASLTALAIRCPGHERVEFAVDPAGRMHLLARDHALRDLKFAECWAKSHRELIAMACPQHQFEAPVKAVCHVFSDEPSALADLHGTDLRLHVLAPVVVNGQTGWYAAELTRIP